MKLSGAFLFLCKSIGHFRLKHTNEKYMIVVYNNTALTVKSSTYIL